jgi:hypothetical protein
MIISFSNTILQTQDCDIQKTLAKILVELIEEKSQIHFIDTHTVANIFFDNEGKYIFNENTIAKEYLGTTGKIELKEYISNIPRKPITRLHRNHLTHFVIGVNSGEIHPNDAYRIINERSKIIVENGINDWKFITAICQKYSSAKKSRQSIYLLLDKAIKIGAIESDNAGGIGEIKKVTQRWINDRRYTSIYNYKLMAIFDSDRKIEDATKIHKKHEDIINFLSQKGVTHHMLHKRKIENYLPLSVIFENRVVKSIITETQKINLENKSRDELDFLEYSSREGCVNLGHWGEKDIKENFPKMFLASFSYREFEKRCEHHKKYLQETDEQTYETEEILLKMAKIL